MMIDQAKQKGPSLAVVSAMALVSLVLAAALLWLTPSREDSGQLGLDGPAAEAKSEAGAHHTRAFRFVVSNRTIAVFYGYAEPGPNWEACQEAAAHEVNGFCEEIR